LEMRNGLMNSAGTDTSFSSFGIDHIVACSQPHEPSPSERWKAMAAAAEG
jgi:hypothetical protein